MSAESQCCVLLSSVLMIQLLNVYWILSFDKDYPTIHQLWITKELILFFLMAVVAFYCVIASWFLPLFVLVTLMALILLQFTLFRIHSDRQNAGVKSSGGLKFPGIV